MTNVGARQNLRAMRTRSGAIGVVNSTLSCRSSATLSAWAISGAFLTSATAMAEV